MKKRLATIFSLIVLVSVLSGCGEASLLRESSRPIEDRFVIASEEFSSIDISSEDMLVTPSSDAPASLASSEEASRIEASRRAAEESRAEESRKAAEESRKAAEEASRKAAEASKKAAEEAARKAAEAQKAAGQDYIANKNTKKFHYTWCKEINKMKESNKWYFHGTRNQLINYGYQPCKKCNP